jgi:hypothetical protein
MNTISTDTVPLWVYWLHMDMTTLPEKCIPTRRKKPMRGEKSDAGAPEKQLILFVWPKQALARALGGILGPLDPPLHIARLCALCNVPSLYACNIDVR